MITLVYFYDIIENFMENVKDVYAEKLMVLAKNITYEEKRQAREMLNISRPTLDKYLSGKGEKIEPAMKLIEFLTEKVKGRLNELLKKNVA